MDNWTCYRGRTQRLDIQRQIWTGYRRKSYGRLDMLQRRGTGTEYMGRSQGQVTEAGNRRSLQSRAGHRVRSQGQATEAGHRDKLHYMYEVHPKSN